MFRLRRRDDYGGTATPFTGGLPPAPASESSVDDLVRGLCEMQAFEVDLLSEEAAVSPADPRRMRDADYKEASRRAKEISAARRAVRVSPWVVSPPSRGGWGMGSLWGGLLTGMAARSAICGSGAFVAAFRVCELGPVRLYLRAQVRDRVG